MAFVRKNVDHGNQDGFTRVVIFLEKKQGGHFGSKERFHAVQVSSWTLKYKKGFVYILNRYNYLFTLLLRLINS